MVDNTESDSNWMKEDEIMKDIDILNLRIMAAANEIHSTSETLEKAELDIVSLKSMMSLMFKLLNEQLKLVTKGNRLNKMICECVKQKDEIIKSNIEDINRFYENESVVQNLQETVEQLDVINECTLNQHFLKIALMDNNESKKLSDNMSVKAKFHQIMKFYDFQMSKTQIVNAFLVNSTLKIEGINKTVKAIKVEFADAYSAEIIHRTIVEKNKSTKAKSGNTWNSEKYFSMQQSSRKIWKLKKECIEMRRKNLIKFYKETKLGIKVRYVKKNVNIYEDKIITRIVRTKEDMICLKEDLCIFEENDDDISNFTGNILSPRMEKLIRQSLQLPPSLDSPINTPKRSRSSISPEETLSDVKKLRNSRPT